MSDIRLSNIIAPSFYDVHRDIKKHNYTHYLLKGGRGSTKSSFISIEIPMIMKKNPLVNAVVMRKVGNTLRGSVYNQIMWGIENLGLLAEFKGTVSPMEIVYIPTGQKIVFLGADDPVKIKSTKFSHGYCGIVWFEEYDQFNGPESIRNINQSLMRGGSKFWAFYSYNPPKTNQNWVNIESLQQRNDRLVHSSTYESVPYDWLGEQFFLEAEQLREHNEKAFRHEYMGEPVGTGGNVFENVTIREITDEEMNSLRCGYIDRANDFGFAVDPNAYVEVRLIGHTLYFLGNEIYEPKLSNRRLVERIKSFGVTAHPIICDCANPKDIAEMRELGLVAHECYKFPGSVDTGIKFLQGLDEIVIDPKRNPAAAKEFSLYEYETTKDGQYISSYPDKDNHIIDGTRYALGKYMGRKQF